MNRIALNLTKPGEYVRLSDKPAAKTYKRGAYDKKTKTFSLSDCADMNGEIFRKSSTQVFTGFDY